ncbi:MAG: HAD family hydrolase [Halieaceae bacterium]|nr:HAD family hydrolase [Halieaceae bacterium]
MFVTGRGLEDVLSLLADPSIPEPENTIADVGASICHGNRRYPVLETQESIDLNWLGETRDSIGARAYAVAPPT